ncbi:MAG: hypothetical protein MAG794_01252 [Gammaproteobacteria bacterium]|nr:hypothetical protein [Gammaproteobacteria bacterium]
MHNNLAERDIRDYVKKRKISGSTRSTAGRRCRDTFASLKKTCRKHDISFWDYLLDRLAGATTIPWLPSAIFGAERQTWQQRYGYQPVLLETFVEHPRFRGTAYRAANWLCIGQTRGRGKLDVHHRARLPKKSIWVYPLQRDFQHILCTDELAR